MARQIEFLAPVEAMRGNLSGKQVLNYPSRDNSAWDAPDGRSYARNYKPRYIGAKNSRTLKTNFAVKRVQATFISPDTRLNMALLGGTQAVWGAILSSAEFAPGTRFTLRIYLNMMYQELRDYGELDSRTTFKQWVDGEIRNALELKTVIGFQAPSLTNLTIKNPWNPTVGPQTAIAITVRDEIIVKFYRELVTGGAYFYVRNMIGVERYETSTELHSFADVINAEDATIPNVLNLTASGNYVKYGDYYLIHQNGSYAQVSESPEPNERFKLTISIPT